MRETSHPPVESTPLAQTIAEVVGQPVRSVAPLAGGMIGRDWKVALADGTWLVAKDAAGDDASLDLEGRMIRYLHDAAVAPIPRVIHASPHLLLQEFMPGEYLTSLAHADLGEIMARLHAVRGPAFGLAGPTLNGSFRLPNGWHDRWVPFFRDQRLGHGAEWEPASRIPGADRAAPRALGGRADRARVARPAAWRPLVVERAGKR